MRDKYSQQLSTSPSDCAMVEVCDICGDIGIAEDILICPKCKTSREHGYCRKIYSNNRTDDWSCDECEGKRTCSPKSLGKDIHTKLASSSSGCIYNKPAHSSLDGKYRRDKMAIKRKIKSISSSEVIMLSSSSKRVDVPVKTVKLINKSSAENAEPMCTSISSYQKGLSLNSPMKSVPLPCKRPINSVAQRQGSRVMPSSSSKRVDVPVKPIKQIHESSSKIVEPMCTSTSSYRKGLSLNSPMKSVPLPCKKPINSRVQQQGSRIMSSSSSKGVDVSVKKQINKSSSKIAEPMCISTSSCRKGLSLNSPMKSVPLPCKRPINSVVQQQGSRILHVPKVTNSVQAITKEIIQMAKSVANMAHSVANMDFARNQDASVVKKTSLEREVVCAPAPDNKFLQPVNSGHKVNGDRFPLITDIEKCKPTDAELKDERYSHVPARHPSWKGRFEIQGANFNYNSSEYMAFSRARSLRCVFECSQRMPAVLQFKLTPRKDVWRCFFPDDCPGEGDIGLYFYSGENKRASDNDFLMKFIKDRDFVMKCDIGEAELYLFTSKLLPAGYQRLYNEYFFWGVFRKIKKHVQ